MTAQGRMAIQMRELAAAIARDILAVQQRLDALESIEDLTAHKVLAEQLLKDLDLLHRRFSNAWANS
jgi:hypothetical protein